MSGGTLMVWLRVCNASIGVPAAMRPMTGTATGRLLSSSEPTLLLRTLPSVPSMTLGVKPRRPLPLLLLPESSGSLMTSMARARLGRRRMKPRSSNAVMRRWMPDFERRSSASFISSKEGGTPDSLRRSLMNRRSSYCLRVSISTNPQVCVSKLDSAVRFRDALSQRPGLGGSNLQASTSETNHERTLYVPYVFCNHLILRQQNRFRRTRRRHEGVSPEAGGCRKQIRRQPRPQTARGSQAPVPQRDFPTTSCPDGRPAWRSRRRRCASQGGRADSLHASHWRRHRVRAAPSHGRGGCPSDPKGSESAAPETGIRRRRMTRDCRAGRSPAWRRAV